jgi:hypothetical protein
MKQIKIFILHLVILTVLSLFFYVVLLTIYGFRLDMALYLFKLYFLWDIAACTSLFLFYINPTLKSKRWIILICLLCALLTSLLGSFGATLSVWYSNIPDEVLLYWVLAFPLTMSKALAGLVSSGITAGIQMLSLKKEKK